MPKKEDGILCFIIFNACLTLDFVTKQLSLIHFAFLRGSVGGKVS